MASVTTRDHEEIRNWADDHGASPAVVSRTGGMLRFEFDTPAELAEVSWDDFFDVFDQRGLELVYDDKPGSRFHKLVYPESTAAKKPLRRPARAKIEPISSRRTASAKPRSGAARTAAKSTRSAKATTAKSTAAKPNRRAPRKAA
ncbi:MAG TPA: hypothetical protein VFP94_07655 [Terriglobales bacterium]|nr:hypothetical protein [Terriglobales bacterium]